MKKNFLPFFVLINGFLFSQYSSYYNVNTNSNVEINANVNHNISGTVYENKTITTIDYGALKLANAQIEKNRLEKLKFADERQRQIAFEISQDPLKAYEYGKRIYVATKDKKMWAKDQLKQIRKNSGLKEFRIEHVVPNELLFTDLDGAHLQNLSSDGITTDIYFRIPYNSKTNKVNDVEKSFEEIIVGEEFDQVSEQNKTIKLVYHRKNLNRATVYGQKGYRLTLSWEDKFEKGITDNYTFSNETYTIDVKVRYNGNKDEVEFDKLEGRRFYLKPLIEKIISTATVGELEILQ